MTDKLQAFMNIMEKSNSEKVIIFTNHYHISGKVYECERCNNEGFVNLTQAIVSETQNVYAGESESGNKYDWLHINIDKITAFSFV